ncbi:MAG: protein-glutamate O-methyltransferase CheR [Candidatus Magnetomorum sp.]|nr:protein-glutamate O-methyltransferase CheR [Candidatus Magnetomorum sp.]
MFNISQQELQVLTGYIYEICGVHLDSSKEYLVKTRLDNLVKSNGCASYSELYYKARSDRTGKINTDIINAITTPETLFFRDKNPFEVLQSKLINEILEKKSSTVLPGHLRIWSAASSTGQEIYSIAITLLETITNINKYKISLTATDISNVVLDIAKSGRYNKFEISRGLTQQQMDKYFIEEDQYWQIKEDIRKMVRFQKINLMQPLIGMGTFDIVFCRNVAIYFTLEDRKKLFDRIANVIVPDGYLFIGSSEFLTGICDRFKAMRHGKAIYYQKIK